MKKNGMKMKQMMGVAMLVLALGTASAMGAGPADTTTGSQNRAASQTLTSSTQSADTASQAQTTHPMREIVRTR